MWRYDTDRGLCFFQTVLIDDQKQTARASLGQVRRAASALILQCAAGAESVGGMARNIGNAFLFFHRFTAPSPLFSQKEKKYDHIQRTHKLCKGPRNLILFYPTPYPTAPKIYSSLTSIAGGDNNLAVILGIYQPNVQCRGTFGPEWSSCRDVLGDMPASKTRLKFGPRNVPGVQQGLPVAVESCEWVVCSILCLEMCFSSLCLCFSFFCLLFNLFHCVCCGVDPHNILFTVSLHIH